MLDQLLDAVRAGESRALVVSGEPGVGKTALLDYLVDQAAGCRAAHAAGVESEMELVFAGLHQLLTPMLGRLDRLPAPQADAVRTAFGLSSGPPPDRFLVGLATLGLLAEVAEEHPLLCLIDDAQWLDRTSAQVLALAARRLQAESVGLVFAARVPSDELAGLPELALEGLREPDARALLDSVLPGPLDPPVEDRIVAEAGGNPLALVELPHGVTELAGGFALPDAVPLSGRIEDSFRRRLDALPADSRRLLQLAAAEPVGNPVLMWRAAERLGVDTRAATAAEDAGLVEIGARVLFRHPLVRSAAYRSASHRERQELHRALAEETDPRLDPDRRAWHWAQAAPGPDEDTAAELERSAGRAQARGGLAAAAAFLTRAAELTPDPAERVRRALDAAFAHVQAGSFDTARTLIAVARAARLDELQRVRIDLLRAQLAFASSRGTEATPLLLAAARRLQPLDVGLARGTYLDAFSAALFGARLNDAVTVSDVAAAAGTAPHRDVDPTAADLLLDGLVALVRNYGSGVRPCRRALEELSRDELSPEENLRWFWLGCVVALELWDDGCAYLLSDRNVDTARRTGRLSELALALSARTPLLVFCGEMSAAAATVVETRSVEEATGISAAPYGALILAAWRGQEQEARELIETTIREAGARGEGIGLAIAEYTRAVLCNGLGRYDEALAAARSAAGHHEVVAENWGLSELIEAAARAGAADQAADALDRLAGKARATGTAWALGIEARGRALLGAGAAADAAFHEAVAHLARTRARAELARTRLLWGEWLRREGRRVDAREQLHAAHDLFDAAGMEAFAERARRELRATGETTRRRTPGVHDELTAQEALIARLAVEGLSNPEIGARLFISARTVKYHLGKVFTKLDISSRAQLDRVLPGDPSTVGSRA